MRWRLWIWGHRFSPDHYVECKICKRETNSHARWCPIWALRPNRKDNKQWQS